MALISVDRIDLNLELAKGRLEDGGLVLLESSGGEQHLVAVAQTISADNLATMLREATGMPMLALPAGRCDAIGIERIGAVSSSGREMMTTFEARRGVTTGISAADRALSMRVASDPAGRADDIVTPGHVVPIRVQHDALLINGPTAEAAAADLVRLAGFPGGAVLCQLLDAVGNSADKSHSDAIAGRLGLASVDAAAILQRRLHSEPLVQRLGQNTIETPTGTVHCATFAERWSGRRHFALTNRGGAGPPVRRVLIFEQDPVGDVFQPDPASPLRSAFRAIADGDDAVLLYLAGAGTPGTGQSEAAQVLVRSQVTNQILVELGVVAVADLDRDRLDSSGKFARRDAKPGIHGGEF